MNKKNPFIDTKRELGTLEDLKYEHDKTEKLNSEFRDAYLKTFELPNPEGMLSRDGLVEILSHSAGSKEDLERNLRRAGYLDE